MWENRARAKIGEGRIDGRFAEHRLFVGVNIFGFIMASSMVSTIVVYYRPPWLEYYRPMLLESPQPTAKDPVVISQRDLPLEILASIVSYFDAPSLGSSSTASARPYPF